jgi:hypothetical protein
MRFLPTFTFLLTALTGVWPGFPRRAGKAWCCPAWGR